MIKVLQGLAILIAFGAAMVFHPYARADEIHYVDGLRTQGQAAYCTWWAETAMFGARNVLWNSTRAIEPINPGANARDFAGITVNQEIWWSWDEKSRQEYAEAAFFGYDLLKRMQQAAEPVDGRTLTAHLYQYCMSRQNTLLRTPGLQPAASSQTMFCENQMRLAESIERDLTAYNIRLEQLTFMTPEDERTAFDVDRCIRNRLPAETVRQCVLRRCMHPETEA